MHNWQIPRLSGSNCRLAFLLALFTAEYSGGVFAPSSAFYNAADTLPRQIYLFCCLLPAALARVSAGYLPAVFIVCRFIACRFPCCLAACRLYICRQLSIARRIYYAVLDV